MKVAIMQPYFLPYIGYFQLINAVDKFVIYDNIQYTKKGWINRNRILLNGKDVFITLPLLRDSDYSDIKDRKLADNFALFAQKQRRMVEQAYRKAPHFKTGMAVYDLIMTFDDFNLFYFIYNSVFKICQFLDIHTEIIISSTLPVNSDLRGANKVMSICKALQGDVYVNPIGGIELYQNSEFMANGILLQFLKPNEIQYLQFQNKFVPWLSIIDLIMFNSVERIRNEYLLNYSILKV